MTTFSTSKISNFMSDIHAFSAERYEIAIQIRDIFFSCHPRIDEDIKYGGLVFFKEKELMSGIFFYKEHISIEFAQGASLSDPNSVLEGKGKLRRHIKIRSMQDILAKNVISYVQESLAGLNTYIVLLRGINVGGHNLLPMKELKILLEGSGYTNVKTYIQSGNIVLSSKRNPESDIGPLIQSQFGFTPRVLVLSEKEFASCVANNPYQEYEGKFVHFYFCKETPRVNTTLLAKLASDTERYELVGDTFYLHAPDGIGRSRLVARIEACLGVPATGRNLNTINKLIEMINKT